MASERVRRRIDRLRDEAESAADAGEWARVRERAEMVLAVDRENSDALAFIALAETARKGQAPPSKTDEFAVAQDWPRTPMTTRPLSATSRTPSACAGTPTIDRNWPGPSTTLPASGRSAINLATAP
ncbi:MAG: hypothetical protein HY678_02320 [Chloroflexi bacterium]|nr:hypothetical protein [Chloroflexota bacterium]